MSSGAVLTEEYYLKMAVIFLSRQITATTAIHGNFHVWKFVEWAIVSRTVIGSLA